MDLSYGQDSIVLVFQKRIEIKGIPTKSYHAILENKKDEKTKFLGCFPWLLLSNVVCKMLVRESRFKKKLVPNKLIEIEMYKCSHRFKMQN